MITKRRWLKSILEATVKADMKMPWTVAQPSAHRVRPEEIAPA